MFMVLSLFMQRDIKTLHVKFNITEYVKSIEMQGLAWRSVKINMVRGLWFLYIKGLDKLKNL